MSPTQERIAELRSQEYRLRLEVDRLRRQVYSQDDPNASPALTEELDRAEGELNQVEDKLATATGKDSASGLLLDSRGEQLRRGQKTTGLEAKVHLRMAQVPTSFYHLLDREQAPLLSCSVYAAVTNEETRRLRVTSFIEGYSARAVNTFELAPDTAHTFDQLPILFQERISGIEELTRASLNILVEDIDSGKVEIHETYPVWLLAQTTAPLYVRDPKSGEWLDMTRYLGAFVTPNARSLMRFLRIAAEHHPGGTLAGYQGDADGVTAQVKAVYEALQQEGDITYVNSVIDHTPDQGFVGQRIRLPHQSLEEKQANCIDGTVLFASLLEGISLNPAIVVVPGHAFLAWETWRDNGKWDYVETTMVGSHPFEQACASARQTAKRYRAQKKLSLMSVAELRTKYGIMPMA